MNMTEKTDDYSYKFGENGFWFSHSYENNPCKNDYYRHNHSSYELYACMSGYIDFVVEDKLYKLPSGSFLLIKPFAYHYASIKNYNEPYNRVVFNFDRKMIFPEILGFLDSEKEFFVWKNEKLLGEFMQLEKAYMSYQKNDITLLAQIRLNEILLDLKYRDGPPHETHILNPSVSLILKYVNEHLYEPLSLKNISANLFLSPTYISQVFSHHMKISVMDYIKQKKIFIAQDMISSGSAPTAVARQLGFNDYSTFYRLYKKYLKDNPSSPPLNN